MDKATKQALIAHTQAVGSVLYDLQKSYPYGIPVKAFREAYNTINISLWQLESVLGKEEEEKCEESLPCW
jgi:hypothetical protein